MLRTILVPLDGSSLGERSLPLARELARASGASLHLAHVHVPHEPDQLLSNTSFQWEGVDMDWYDARERRKEQEYLAEVMERMSGDGASVRSQVIDGRLVAEQLAEYASEMDTDMVIITSHGYSGVKRALEGSIADSMLRKSNVPMLVAHPPRAEWTTEPKSTLDHIMVTLDGSRLAEHILGPAADLARATGARITLTHVLVSPTLFGPRILRLKPDDQEPDLAGALEYLERAARGLRDQGLRADIHATQGSTPAHTIAEAADRFDADVIALATHGYGGLKRTVLGSVADKLLRASSLPLLLLRPHEEG